jgi:carbamoyltransferase
MITWGISANSHNAALAVFDSDRLVFASESERFSKVKNDPDLSSKFIEYALKFGEPNKVVWYENPWLKTLRQFYAGQEKQDNNVKNYLKKYNITSPIKTISHHYSHAAAGYYTSKFNDACVLVIDAIGEFETITIWQATGNHLKKIWRQHYPHSIGLFYSAITQRIGLKPNEEEYILMGMAAYGDKFKLNARMNNDFVDYNTLKFKQSLHRGCLDWAPDLTEDDNFNIAAAAQDIYEKYFQLLLSKAKKLTNSKNLVLMGGCALNCSANPIAYKYFENVWIMPAPGDSGSAIGAVLADSKQHIEWTGPYLGHDMGYTDTNEIIVNHLLEHKMCGVARGRAEFGPRALGNRSLIADPRGVEIKARINSIKQREQFRPFAPAILEEFADQYFKMPTKSTPYMQYIAPCLKSESFPAIVHVDNTSRVQTVNKTDNPQFRELLEIWYAKTGCPMLLNTSLNIKGQPMVNDHADATAWGKAYGLPVFN